MQIILRHDGVSRYYPCANIYDLIVLRDALERRYGAECVEAWNGTVKL